MRSFLAVTRSLFLPALLLITAACGELPPAREDWRHAGVEGSHPLRAGTDWVSNSREWKEIADARFAAAGDFAERESKRRDPGSWAVVLDIDETVVSNIEYHRMQDRKGKQFNPNSWRDWVEERSAEPVPGAIAFIDRVNALGGNVALVTNRRSYEEEATIDNLSRVGLEKGRDYAVLFTYAWPDGVKEKDPRFIEVERQLGAGKHHGVTTIAYIGDQWTDRPLSMPKHARFFCIPQGNLYGNPCELEGVKKPATH